MAEKRNACRVLVGKPKVNTLLGRPRHRWEGSGKMNLQEVEWGVLCVCVCVCVCVWTEFVWLGIGLSGGCL